MAVTLQVRKDLLPVGKTKEKVPEVIFSNADRTFKLMIRGIRMGRLVLGDHQGRL